MEPAGSLPYSKKPPLFNIVREMNRAHNHPANFFKSNFNIIFPSEPKSSLQVLWLIFFTHLWALVRATFLA
jgi:hypothetical protein